MVTTPFLQVDAVSKTYKNGTAVPGVKNITLNIEQGKITAVIGESGSGKSTLLKLLYGLISPDTGEVKFNGELIWGPEQKLIPGHDAMKMVTQNTDDLNLYAQVWDNVAAMLPNTNIKAKEDETKTVLTQLNMMQLAKQRVADLSGGEKQRVAIARAIVTRPRVLLLDEPFNQVDTSFREGLQQDIRQIVKDTGLTVIMVSHDPAEVLSMADELVVIKDGSVIEKGLPVSIYQHPLNLYTAALLANCNVLNAGDANVCGIKVNKEYVVIYPEWISISSFFKAKHWTVKQVLFKGPYEYLILENKGARLRVVNIECGKYAEGNSVGLKIKKWLEY